MAVPYRLLPGDRLCITARRVTVSQAAQLSDALRDSGSPRLDWLRESACGRGHDRDIRGPDCLTTRRGVPLVSAGSWGGRRSRRCRALEFSRGSGKARIPRY
jgi:hypothetical protein